MTKISGIYIKLAMPFSCSCLGAEKRKVVLGESSYNYVEVKEGLSEGEIVITSDMNRYVDENKLKIRN